MRHELDNHRTRVALYFLFFSLLHRHHLRGVSTAINVIENSSFSNTLSVR
jgi:hypothetical protein